MKNRAKSSQQPVRIWPFFCCTCADQQQQMQQHQVQLPLRGTSMPWASPNTHPALRGGNSSKHSCLSIPIPLLFSTNIRRPSRSAGLATPARPTSARATTASRTSALATPAARTRARATAATRTRARATAATRMRALATLATRTTAMATLATAMRVSNNLRQLASQAPTECCSVPAVTAPVRVTPASISAHAALSTQT